MRNRGVTLIEILVTGSLFAIVLTMVGKAMVMGHRAQSNISEKISIHRAASNALDVLVRDAEMARLTSRVYLFIGLSPQLVPTTATSIGVANEFRIDSLVQGTTIYDPPDSISVGYWRSTPDNTLRRSLYDPSDPSNPLPGTPAGGKILARDVSNFQISLNPDVTTGLGTLTAVLTVSTIRPLTTQVTLELP